MSCARFCFPLLHTEFLRPYGLSTASICQLSQKMFCFFTLRLSCRHLFFYDFFFTFKLKVFMDPEMKLTSTE